MSKRKMTKEQSTIYKTYHRVTRTSLKTGGELRWSVLAVSVITGMSFVESIS